MGEKSYQVALMQDLLRHGGTYISTNKHGFTIYINSAITKVLVMAGVVGAAGIIGGLLSSAGLGGAALANAKEIIVGVASAGGTKAMDRGIYVKFSNKGNLVSWGYQ